MRGRDCKYWPNGSATFSKMPARELGVRTPAVGEHGRGAIRSGKQDACADVMTGDRKARSKKKSTRRTSKNALQFAPNFSVYTMLPDVVCLYSDDRKFFLHGELYCALVSAIGRGGKSAQELVRELARDFPADKINEAIQRLIERRYVVAAPGASLGLGAVD